MAPKKTTKSAVKAAETPVKPEAVAAPKAEIKKPVAAVAETPKAEEKKEAAPKDAEKKASARKAPVRKTVKKADQKTALYVQFSGKSYSQDELVKMAQDVWKYDLKQKVRELATIELYVKPEENVVYYVMNQEFTGSFVI